MNKLFYININQIRTDENLLKVRERLSQGRLEKADRCAHFNDKLRSLAAGLLIDCGLEFYHLHEKTATYSYSTNGKPHVEGHPEIHFSVSHSGDYVVCAFSEHPVGVDIEKIKNVKPSLIKYACDPEETAEINAFTPGDFNHSTTFFDIWTRKESFVKYLGVGLTVRPSEISQKYSDRLSEVHFYNFEISDGYRCTLCSRCERPELIHVDI